MPKTKAGDSGTAGQKKLRVEQIRSGIGRSPVHRRTLVAIGLRHHQHVVEVTDTPQMRGMLFQVRHLVDVTPVEA